MPAEGGQFHALVKKTNGSPDATQLREFIAARQADRNGGMLTFALGVIVLAAAFGILNIYDLNGWEPALFFPAFLYFGASLLAGAQALNEEEEREMAARALTQLEAEAREERFAAVPEDVPFVLFLRSFEIERRGETEDEYTIPHNYVGRMMGIPQPSRYPDDGVFMPFNYDWVQQMEALKLVREVLPTVMLDNLTLTAKKQRELEAAGIVIVSVMTTDWWDVFLRLAARASAIVFYAETQSSMLSREMRHVAQAGKPYLVLGSAAIRQALEQELPAFLENAIAVLPTSGCVFESGKLKETRDLQPVLRKILSEAGPA